MANNQAPQKTHQKGGYNAWNTRVVKHRIPIPDIANSKMFYIVHKILILRIVPHRKEIDDYAALYKRVIQRNIKEAQNKSP